MILELAIGHPILAVHHIDSEPNDGKFNLLPRNLAICYSGREAGGVSFKIYRENPVHLGIRFSCRQMYREVSSLIFSKPLE